MLVGRLATSTRRAKSIGVEAISTLREAALMTRDLGPVLPEAKAGDDVVVLVHGFLASAGVFRPMRRRLEQELGARTATFTHVPGVGVRRIALTLAKIIDRIPPGTRIHLVGHSLGGLVARWYVEELGGYARVTQTISLASPFGGAPMAKKLPYFVGNDLHDESELLHRLRARARRDVPHTSIIGTADRVVFPVESALFPHGERHVLPGRGHNALLFDEEAVRIVIDRIRAAAREPTTPDSLATAAE